MIWKTIKWVFADKNIEQMLLLLQKRLAATLESIGGLVGVRNAMEAPMTLGQVVTAGQNPGDLILGDDRSAALLGVVGAESVAVGASVPVRTGGEVMVQLVTGLVEESAPARNDMVRPSNALPLVPGIGTTTPGAGTVYAVVTDASMYVGTTLANSLVKAILLTPVAGRPVG